MTTKDYLLRVNDGGNLKRSSKHQMWGINTKCTNNRFFLKKVQPGDRLWFVTSKSKGTAVAVATYISSKPRETEKWASEPGLTNEELGWFGDGTWDTEIHYTALYNLQDWALKTEIKGVSPIRTYTPEKCKVNLPEVYDFITRDVQPTFNLL